MTRCRTAILTLVLGLFGAALLPTHQANAWWDHWGRWHPAFVRPPVVIVSPPPVVYAPRPYAHWVPPFYDRWGRWHAGHWA